VVAAFLVHVAVAVLAGSLLRILPEAMVQGVTATLFGVGAVALLRAARGAGREEPGVTRVERHATIGATVGGSFGLLLLAEWGDLTQLATASLAANSGAPLSTGIGAFVALATVAAIAASVGRQLVSRVPLRKVNYIGALVFAGLALWTVVDLLG
jgi:putative Ca2+/H+ antiporter (TMEM165/GDT1 family)